MKTAAVGGVQAHLVTAARVDYPGTEANWLDISGLAELSVREARVRVRSAIRHAGLDFPQGKFSVSLDPPDVRKDGTSFDLPTALAVLQVDPDGIMAVGELSPTGQVRPVCGVLAVAELAAAQGCALVCPADNAAEALAVLPPDRVLPARDLGQVVACLQGKQAWPEHAPPPAPPEHARYPRCWSDVRGHEHAKRALEVAAAGGHNAVLMGTPGTGRTMLSRRLPTILPELTVAEAIEVTKIYSVAGLLPNRAGLLRERPFRAPHHTASAAALVGGGSIPRPGEVSLAHRGVLFLDELPEFPRHVIETLRQPLEDGYVTVTRARQAVRFPATAMVVAALNPCPCGHYPDTRCSCAPLARERYRARLDTRMLDRVDIQLRLEPQPLNVLRDATPGEPSAVVRARVQAARDRQAARYGVGWTNGNVSMNMLRKAGPLRPAVHDLLLWALDANGMGLRAHDPIWRVARTLADLDGAEDIGVEHIGEALQYRWFDRPAKEEK